MFSQRGIDVQPGGHWRRLVRTATPTDHKGTAAMTFDLFSGELQVQLPVVEREVLASDHGEEDAVACADQGTTCTLQMISEVVLQKLTLQVCI